MEAYKFEDKKDDANFLAGRPVICKAFFNAKEDQIPKAGDAILILLSSGKKYKGLVKELKMFTIKDVHAGELIIVRQGLTENP